MAKLKLISIQRGVLGPTKRSGVKKNLLKRDGITSDGINDDDESSSLSDRQTTKGKKKLNATKFLRRIASRSGDEEEDGYESDASTGSNRSTSSSFLRYQNRPVWKSKFVKKFVLQRRGDLSETPVESGTKWPLFDRIYKRQNHRLKKGEEEDEQEDSDIDDDESVASAESNGDCPLAPPAPQWCGEEEDCIDDIDEVGFKAEDVGDGEEQKKGTFGMIRRSLVRAVSSPVAAEKRPDESKEKSKGSVETVGELLEVSSNAPAADTRASSPTTIQVSEIRVTKEDSADHVMTTQESGIPTYESPKEQSAQQFPTQKPLLPQSSDQKKASLEDNRDISPHSIPHTICYSLRSAIGDGSARQRNSHSLMERRPLRPNGSAVDLSYWSHRGKRNYMEDRFIIEHLGSTNKDKEDSKPISLLAVFDGHGGSAASQFCSDWLSSYVRKKNEHWPGSLGLAMKEAFTKMDADVVASGQCDGTTACACAIVGAKVVCSNVGDSRAIIVKRDGTAVALSEDHKPDRDDETKRINDLGGRVIHWGRWRVEGVLAVSRAIGDARLKPYVTANPDIVEHDICDDDMFLVVASDGVWDTMSNDLVAKFVLVNTCRIVNKSLLVDDRLLRWIARQISKRARENGSSDNISCIVANLTGTCN